MAKGGKSFVRAAIAISLMVAFGVSVFAQDAKPEAKADQQGPTLLFDAFTGEVISESRAGEPWYPASLTKLMTAYIIFKKLRDGTMQLDQQLPISELAHSQPASHIGFPVGKMVSVDFALQALLVHSANDMAYVLAEGADGTADNFAVEMNANAKGLGLLATHFVNPNGLYDPRHISSARDLGVIAAVIINQFPEYLHYFKQDSVTVGKRKLANYNSLIRIMPEAVGMKTGFICNSGFNLVGSAVRDGHQLISVVLGAHSGNARAALSKTMLDDGFDEIGKSDHGRVSDITDEAYGAIVPADMTTTVCKQKQAVTPINAHRLSGWGISFGNFETAQRADMALRGRLISPVGIDAGGIGGIIEMPDKGGFTAMLWNLDQAKSLDLCTKYHTEAATCDVMPDTLLAQMAAAAPPEADSTDPTDNEGSDGVDPKVDVKVPTNKAKPASDKKQ
ncbi:MAG: D-alanyl-D-alanine carboxypeptidase family protein [Aestuariivirga sp.]